MNQSKHFQLYYIFCSLLYIFNIFAKVVPGRFIFTLFVGFFLVNPDYDLLLGIKHHRNFFTHSALYPIFLYFSLYPYIAQENADYFGIVIFFPVIVHMIGDFKIRHLLETQRGSWLISFFGKRFTTKQTYAWFFVNIGGMGIYIILVLCGKWELITTFFNNIIGMIL